MQVAAYCEEKTYIGDLKQDNPTILHFSLRDILPEDCTLALNIPLGTLSCLTISNEEARLVMQLQFTRSELSLLIPLLQACPYYCPYEVLFANFYNSNASDPIIARSRQHLQRALASGRWEQELRPMRNVLSRTRLKLRTFGINISSILETGCILMAVPDIRTHAKAG